MLNVREDSSERERLCAVLLSRMLLLYTEMKTFSLRLLTQLKKRFEKNILRCISWLRDFVYFVCFEEWKNIDIKYGERESRLSTSLWHKRRIYGKFTSRCSSIYNKENNKKGNAFSSCIEKMNENCLVIWISISRALFIEKLFV